MQRCPPTRCRRPAGAMCRNQDLPAWRTLVHCPVQIDNSLPLQPLSCTNFQPLLPALILCFIRHSLCAALPPCTTLPLVCVSASACTFCSCRVPCPGTLSQPPAGVCCYTAANTYCAAEQRCRAAVQRGRGAGHGEQLQVGQCETALVAAVCGGIRCESLFGATASGRLGAHSIHRSSQNFTITCGGKRRGTGSLRSSGLQCGAGSSRQISVIASWVRQECSTMCQQACSGAMGAGALFESLVAWQHCNLQGARPVARR